MFLSQTHIKEGVHQQQQALAGSSSTPVSTGESSVPPAWAVARASSVVAMGQPLCLLLERARAREVPKPSSERAAVAAAGGKAGGAGAARAEHVERGGTRPGVLQHLRAHAQGRVPGRDLPPHAPLQLLRRLLHQPARPLPPHRRDHLGWTRRGPHPGLRPPRDRPLFISSRKLLWCLWKCLIDGLMVWISGTVEA